MSLLEAARNNNLREIYRILANQGRAISAREKIQAISVVNMTISMAIGILFGLTAPMLLLATVGTFTFSMTILWIRNSIKSSCMESYRDKNAVEVAQLSPEVKSAFHEGCDAAQNYLHHTNACLPTSNAFWHPKAFYAGFEAMTIRQDYANVGLENELRETDQFIRKIVQR